MLVRNRRHRQQRRPSSESELRAVRATGLSWDALKSHDTSSAACCTSETGTGNLLLKALTAPAVALFIHVVMKFAEEWFS